jgi:predicted RNase H-like nuclease
VGIDVPFGWPLGFAEAVTEYMAAPDGAWRPEADEFKPRAYFRERETDRVTREETGRRGKRVTPLSVSAEKIGAPAMKAAWIATQLAVRHGCPVDRSGLEGRLVEVYPAAAVALWKLKVGKYKNVKAADRARSLNRAIEAVLEELPLPVESLDTLATEHQLDALLCALVARAARTGRTRAPAPGAQAEKARLEGWIHLPTAPIASLA